MVWFNIFNLFKGSRAQVAGSVAQQTDVVPAPVAIPTPPPVPRAEDIVYPGLIQFLRDLKFSELRGSVPSGKFKTDAGEVDSVGGRLFVKMGGVGGMQGKAIGESEYIAVFHTVDNPTEPGQVKVAVAAALMHNDDDLGRAINASFEAASSNGSMKILPLETVAADMQGLQRDMRDSITHARRVASYVDPQMKKLFDAIGYSGVSPA